MVKTEHQLQSIPWETQAHSQQQQLDYYMNVPASSYTNVNLIINNTNTTNRIHCNGSSQLNHEPKLSPSSANSLVQNVPSSTPKSRSNSGKTAALSPSADYGSTGISQHKEIYPWMSDKKHGSNKSKSNAKNPTAHNTTSTSSSSSTSGRSFFPRDEDLVNETCEDENNGQRFSSRREVRKNARISRRSPATSTTRCVWFDTQRKHVKHHLIYSEQLICDGHPLIVTKRSCLRVSAIAVFLSSRERFPVEHVSQSETHTQSERAKIRPRKKSFKQWLGCLIIADRPNRRLSVSTYTCFSSSITDRRARGRVRIFAYWRW